MSMEGTDCLAGATTMATEWESGVQDAVTDCESGARVEGGPPSEVAARLECS